MFEDLVEEHLHITIHTGKYIFCGLLVIMIAHNALKEVFSERKYTDSLISLRSIITMICANDC